MGWKRPHPPTHSPARRLTSLTPSPHVWLKGRRSGTRAEGGRVPASSVRSLSRVRLFGTPWTAACQASLSITSSQSLFKLMSVKLVMLSNHLILCHPFLLSPSIFPSIRMFSKVSVHIWWPKYWSFSFSISPFNEYSGVISFRMNWLDLFAVQRTLKSLLQHHSSKTLSFPYSPTSSVLSFLYDSNLTSIHD